MTPRAGQTKKRTRIQEINEQRILDAAMEIFASQGFKGSTIDQIAARANMSKPNLLYYFRRKQDIYLALLEHTLKDWLAPLESLSRDGDPFEQIGNYIKLKLQSSRLHPMASRLFANEILHGAPMIGNLLATELKDIVDRKAEVIQGWIDQRLITPIDPHQLIFMIWAATQTHADFQVQARAVIGDEIDDTEYWEKISQSTLTLFLQGLRPNR